MDDFNTEQSEENGSFYRQLDPENLEHYYKFLYQTRNPREAIHEDNEPYLGDDDTQPDEEYENVKKFYQTMTLQDLGELNKIYNFQDTVVLSEMFEQRSIVPTKTI